MNLLKAKLGEENIISKIDISDNDFLSFLFSLGCYEGEPITVISFKRGGCIVAIKDSRYSIDNQLAKCIYI